MGRPATLLLLLLLLATPGRSAETFCLSSPAIPTGGPIPALFTCEGADVSPPLRWRGVPPGTKSLALLVHDPDAPGGDFVHWILVGLDPGRSSLAQDPGEIPGTVQGQNNFGTRGYRGPCPPPGAPHRYVFELLALDGRPGLEPGFTPARFLKAVKGHELGRARFVASFGRPAPP